MSFAQRQKIVFWGVVALTTILIGVYEYSGLHQETMHAARRSSFRYIYSNSPYGTYVLGTVNGVPQELPQVNGQSYNVVYFRGGMVGRLITSYYFVPETVLMTLPSAPCYSSPKSEPASKGCIDLLSLPDTTHVATVWSVRGFILEVLLVLILPIIVFWFVWRKYIYAHHRH